MLDSFETRLTGIVAELLAGGGVQAVTRPRGDDAAVAGESGKVVVVVRILTVEPDRQWGDDSREKLGLKGQYRTRTSLSLHGQVAIDLTIDPSSGAGLGARRQTLLAAVDRLLVALQTERIRNGRQFLADTDLGFELDGFRFNRVGPPEEAPASFSTLRVYCTYSGRFWPVEPAAEGDLISTLPARLLVLPVEMPERVRAKAGGPDVGIPLRMDLRSLNGATATVIARLQGTSPPGSLVGDAAGVPAGWTGFTPDAQGVVRIVYHPPATVAGTVQVRVTVALSQADRASVPLPDLLIEVQ